MVLSWYFFLLTQFFVFEQLQANPVNLQVQEAIESQNQRENLEIIFQHLLQENQRDSLAKYGYEAGRLFYAQKKVELAKYCFNWSSKANSDLENYSCRASLMICLTGLSYGRGELEVDCLKQFTKSNCSEDLKAVAHQELALFFEYSGDYETAIQISLENQVIFKQNNNDRYLRKTYYTLGNNYSYLENAEKAIDFYTTGLSTFQPPIGDIDTYIKFLVGRAQEYGKIAKTESAEKDYLQVIAISKKYQDWETYYHSMDQLGLLYSQSGNYELAHIYFDQVIQSSHPGNKRKYSSLANKSDLLAKNGQLTTAVSMYDRSLKDFFYKEKLQYNQVHLVKNKEVLLQILQGYMQILVQKEDANETSVRQLLQMTETIAKTSLNFANKKSIYEWREKVKPIYEFGIQYYANKNRVEECFELIEQSKAIFLLQELQLNRHFESLNGYSQLQEEIREQEKMLEMDIEGVAKSERLLCIQDLKDSIQTVLKTRILENSLPLMSIKEVQTKLNDEEILSNYFWGDQYLICVSLTSDSQYVQTIQVEDSVEHEMLSYIKKLKQPYQTKDEVIQQQNLGNYWGTQLLPYRKKHLIILPDGLLNFLPFEALQEEEDFLLENHIIKYGFSSSTYFFDRKKKTESMHALGFAPLVYSDSLNLEPLEGGLIELKPLRKKYSSHILLNDRATKAELLQLINDVSLVHISSHASGGSDLDEFPWVATQDAKIFLPEIYELNLNSDLVVLSACETNIGRQVKGEGVLSLTRAFTQAGAKSVIASQWKVNEKSTQEIMNDFYANVSKGQMKAEALNIAKMNFVRKNPTLAKSPYYWAGLVYYGQNSEIQLGKKCSFDRRKILFLGFVVLIFLFFGIKKESRKY